MLSSTIIAALLAIGSALGSNGYGNTIDSRFDKLSDRTDKYTLYQVISQPDAVPAEATDNLVPSQPDAEPVEASLSSSESPAQEYSVKERCERYTMKNQGLEREYYLYRPEGLKAGAPLVIVLHGYGGSALKGKKAMMDVADKNGFAVCYPQGIKDPKGKPGWNVRYPSQEGMKTDDVKFLIALSKELQKRFDLSPKNTFLTGMSNGGDIIYLIAMRAPKAFKPWPRSPDCSSTGWRRNIPTSIRFLSWRFTAHRTTLPNGSATQRTKVAGERIFPFRRRSAESSLLTVVPRNMSPSFLAARVVTRSPSISSRPAGRR